MVFPIAGGTQDTGYEISNSLRYNDGDSARLSHTTGSSGSARTFTWSMWLKRSTLGSTQYFFNSNNGHSDAAFLGGLFNSSDELLITSWNGGTELKTNRLFRDVSAWYHIVFAIDTTQSTNTNRVKMYINGTQETSFDTASYPSQNYDFTGVGNSGVEFIVGAMENTSPAYANFYDGYISEFNFVDGTAYAASDFGETNDNGVWVPKKPAITYGTNGYKLEFKQTGTSANSSGIGADTSGNDNHFTPSNLAATDVTTDTPTNNFATLNPLQKTNGQVLSEGNLKSTADDSKWFGSYATIEVSSGKWFWETKSDSTNIFNGIQLTDGAAIDYDAANPQNFTGAITYLHNGDKRIDGSDTSYGNSYTTEIIGIALNMDDEEITFYKNGSSQGTIDLSSSSYGVVSAVPFISKYDGYVEVNFGNPSFSISSGNSDANGYGNFEYTVPSGYYALCTKNLAEYG